MVKWTRTILFGAASLIPSIAMAQKPPNASSTSSDIASEPAEIVITASAEQASAPRCS